MSEKKSVKSWAKGRKDPTLLVRLDVDVHALLKQESEESKMTLKDLVSTILRFYLNALGKLEKKKAK